MDGIVHAIVDNFGGKVAKELIVFVISMIPVLELRGSLLAADAGTHATFAACSLFALEAKHFAHGDNS